MECKDSKSLMVHMEKLHWNITRMECKENNFRGVFIRGVNWNITRMECKGQVVYYLNSRLQIGI